MFVDMENRKSRRNTSIDTLIKRYDDKKSSKVAEVRKEIQQRFWALDWKDQKKILAAFLNSGKVDRHWAYKQLLDYWDKSFEDTVRALWEKYHEQRCKWVVIRHLSLEYVRQNMQDFTEERDYFFACLRLAKVQDFDERWFVIDLDGNTTRVYTYSERKAMGLLTEEELVEESQARPSFPPFPDFDDTDRKDPGPF